jgi:phytoene dehydrogenase-like protein
MIAIPNGLAALGKEFGAEIRLNTLVDRILVDKNNVVRGVKTSDGREITAPIVLSNVNALVTYNNLVGLENLPWHIKIGINSFKPSMGCPMVYLAMDKAPDLNAHHTMVAASIEQLNKVWYEFKADVVPNRGGDSLPYSLVCWPTDADPDLAPGGHHLVNMIYNGPLPYSPLGSNWDLLKNQYIDEAIDFFDRVFSPGIKKHIVFAKASTPLDFERRLRAPRGCIYGLEFDVSTLGPMRPRSRSWAVKNLYLAGASTHMSGGIPTVN